jgi:predicted RNA polymerase sigma factor
MPASRQRLAPWQQALCSAVASLYDLLLRLSPSPAVRLNRAIAVGERDGPAAMLQTLDEAPPVPTCGTQPGRTRRAASAATARPRRSYA